MQNIGRPIREAHVWNIPPILNNAQDQTLGLFPMTFGGNIIHDYISEVGLEFKKAFYELKKTK